MNEFEIIQRYFNQEMLHESVTRGVGDDAAVLSLAEGQQLLTSVDTQVVGQHFFEDTAPYVLGHRLLAVNLSDIYAMGAIPKWFTLALTLPKVDSLWLSEFSEGLLDCAKTHGVNLVGGDTTKGPLTLSVTIYGTQKSDSIVYRDGAYVGDSIYVTGPLGNAALALDFGYGELQLESDHQEAIEKAFHFPKLHPKFAARLAEFASSAIDISDGLAQDLSHILRQSGGLGANLIAEQLPIAPFVKHYHKGQALVDAVLQTGDEYALCFTVSPHNKPHCEQIARITDTPVTEIGEITESGLCLISAGESSPISISGWQHF